MGRDEPSGAHRPRSRVQRWIMRLAPGLAAGMERESREWILTCPNCDNERNYWELGGIRYGAKSIGKRVRVSCPACGESGWHKVEHRPQTAE